jgi:hypothetical protein
VPSKLLLPRWCSVDAYRLLLPLLSISAAILAGELAAGTLDRALTEYRNGVSMEGEETGREKGVVQAPCSSAGFQLTRSWWDDDIWLDGCQSLYLCVCVCVCVFV